MAAISEAGEAQAGAQLVLESFRVRMYRSIVDSGEVPVFPLTALVGRSESGKTALLQALASLPPDGPRPALELDWPRTRRGQRSAGQQVCSARFRVPVPVGAPMAALLGLGGTPAHVRIGRDYGGRVHVECELDGQPAAPVPVEVPSQAALEAALRRWLPPFVYLDRGGMLAGALPLGEPAAAVSSGAAALLALAGLAPEELRAELAPERLRAASERLARALEGRGDFGPLGLTSSCGRLLVWVGRGAARAELDRAPEDVRFSVTLEVLSAAARGGRERAVVLLLDGPGRSLRAGGPEGLRRRLGAHARDGSTVLYTARLPFQVDLQHPEQVLVLARADGDTFVGDLEFDGGVDLSLRAALGMTGRASFLVADPNLVVEGPSDADLLLALDGLLARSGEAGLPPGINLVRAGGSYEVASAAAFFARQGLGTIALFDSDAAGRAARAVLARAVQGDRRAARARPLLLAEAAGLEREEAAIEDLFPPELYLSAVREACRSLCPERLLRELAPPASGKITAHLKRLFQAHGLAFPKGDVASALVRRIEGLEHVSALPAETVAAARRLMAALRSAAGAASYL